MRLFPQMNRQSLGRLPSKGPHHDPVHVHVHAHARFLSVCPDPASQVQGLLEKPVARRPLWMPLVQHAGYRWMSGLTMPLLLPLGHWYLRLAFRRHLGRGCGMWSQCARWSRQLMVSQTFVAQGPGQQQEAAHPIDPSLMGPGVHRMMAAAEALRAFADVSMALRGCDWGTRSLSRVSLPRDCYLEKANPSLFPSIASKRGASSVVGMRVFD